MMFCPACGNEMHEAAVSCPSCGRPNEFGSAAGQRESSSWFSLRGRISRKEYWLHYVLPLVMVAFAGDVADQLFHMKGKLSYLVSLLLIVPNLGASVKRLHDHNRSGWFCLLVLIPIVGWLWLFVQNGFLRGTPGPNRFGQDPLVSTRGYGRLSTS